MTINPLDHLGLVRKHAKRMQVIGFRESYDDLFQVGFIGLMEACKRFEDRGSAFSSYAVPWIRGEILHYLRKQCGRSHKKPLYTAKSLDESFVETESDYRFVDWANFFKQQENIEYESIKSVWITQWEKEELERKVVKLYIIDGLKNHEVAKVLNINPMTVSRRLKSGLIRLKWAYLFALHENLENHSNLVDWQSKDDRSLYQELSEKQSA